MNVTPPNPTMPSDTLGHEPYRSIEPDPWGSVRPAGFGIRAGARIIDMMARTLVSAVVGAAYGAFLAIVAPERLQAVSDGGDHANGLGFLMGIMGATLYHSVTECYGGASVGKVICGLRVTTPTLGRATLGGAVVRNLAFFLDGLFFGLVAHSAMSRSDKLQRHGDRWGNTVVVHAEGAPEAVRRTGAQLALWVCVGLAIEAALVLTSLMVIREAG